MLHKKINEAWIFRRKIIFNVAICNQLLAEDSENLSPVFTRLNGQHTMQSGSMSMAMSMIQLKIAKVENICHVVKHSVLNWSRVPQTALGLSRHWKMLKNSARTVQRTTRTIKVQLMQSNAVVRPYPGTDFHV